MYFWTPTRDFFNASKLEEYNIFFLTLAVSGHQDIKNNFCFFEAWNFKFIKKSAYQTEKILIVWYNYGNCVLHSDKHVWKSLVKENFCNTTKWKFIAHN